MTVPTDRTDLSVPVGFDLNLDQYLGLWLIEPTYFQQAFDCACRLDIRAHFDGVAPRIAARVRSQEREQVRVKVIEVQGTLTKRGSSFSPAGSTILLRQAVRRAAQDPGVGAIMLLVDSPGGTAAGTADLAREVADANQAKPVYAVIEDLGASAAYWVASQARKVFANEPAAFVGSIGAYMGLYDFSKQAEMIGVRPVVIQTGPYKAAGLEGTEITPEHQAYFQRLVDKIGREFFAAVRTGRGLSDDQLAAVTDGRVFFAEEALSLKLIDGIQSFDAAMEQLASEVSTQSSLVRRAEGPSRPDPKGRSMSETKNDNAATEAKPQPATFAQLKAGLPGADPEFLCAQLEASATLEQAQLAWMKHQGEQLKTAQDELAQARERAGKRRVGVEPLGVSGGATATADTDPIAAWNEAVSQQVKLGKSKALAIRAVVTTDPELHAAYIAATNAGRQLRHA